MERLVAACPQDRLAQPLQPEDEEEPADDEPQSLDRDHGERRSERGDGDRQGDCRGAQAGERRPPAACEPGGEDDRQRLHHLDRAREERGEDEEGVAGAHVAGLERPSAAALAAAVATSAG